MNVMNHTPLRELLEDAEARGSVDADEVEAAIAGLDLTEDDEADLRRQLVPRRDRPHAASHQVRGAASRPLDRAGR